MIKVLGTLTQKYPKIGYLYQVYSCFKYLMPTLVLSESVKLNTSSAGLNGYKLWTA